MLGVHFMKNLPPTSLHDFMYQPNLRDYRALHVTLLTSIKTIPLVLKTLLLILLISIRETVYTY
jgi:hypothetical protein